MAEGLLTPVQHQLLQVIQLSGREGETAAEIWRKFRSVRRVSRTTVLKMLERLEARKWVGRVEAVESDKRVRFFAKVNPSRTALKMLTHFVNDYYEGSAAGLISDLLRFKCLDNHEKERLRRRLDKGCGSPKCSVCDHNA
jgi:predicted transcriptional regulator